MYMKFEVAAMIRNMLDGGLTVKWDRHNDTHTDRHTDRHTDGQTDRVFS